MADGLTSERLRAVEVEIEHLREFKESTMTTLEELRRDGELIREVHQKVQALSEAPKNAAWWTEKVLTILLAVAAVAGILRYGATPAPAQPVSQSVIEKIADESARRTAMQMRQESLPAQTRSTSTAATP